MDGAIDMNGVTDVKSSYERAKPNSITYKDVLFGMSAGVLFWGPSDRAGVGIAAGALLGGLRGNSCSKTRRRRRRLITMMSERS